MAKAARATTYHQKFRKYRISGDYKKAKKYRKKYKKATGTSLRKLVGRENASLKFLRAPKFPISFAVYKGMTKHQRGYRGLKSDRVKNKQDWENYLPRQRAEERKIRKSLLEAEKRLRYSTLQLRRSIRIAKQDKKVFDYYASQKRK